MPVTIPAAVPGRLVRPVVPAVLLRRVLAVVAAGLVARGLIAKGFIPEGLVEAGVVGGWRLRGGRARRLDLGGAPEATCSTSVDDTVLAVVDVVGGSVGGSGGAAAGPRVGDTAGGGSAPVSWATIAAAPRTPARPAPTATARRDGRHRAASTAR